MIRREDERNRTNVTVIFDSENYLTLKIFTFRKFNQVHWGKKVIYTKVISLSLFSY